MKLLPLFAALAAGSSAQTLPINAPLPIKGVSSYDSAIPQPQDVIGFRIGTSHTRSDLIAKYFDAVDAKSARVMVQRQGLTYEGRELYHAIVASPENMKRLDAIQKQNRRLLFEADKVTDQELEKMPMVIWMGYGVHGNEASSSEAAMLAIYHLAAAKGEWIDRLLDNVVIILDPNYNPDGRDRFVNWVNSNRGFTSTDDTNDREHREPWPGGRTNHYLFDLNRDWLPLTQVESQVRHKFWTAWRPELTLDYHEMGAAATYFFQPGIQSRVHPLTPPNNQKLTLKFGSYHAEALRELNELYFTEERYDDFYPGKGSTYCDLEGSVGILFEQASSRSLKTPGQGRVLDYATTIRNQAATTIASLNAAVDMRLDFLRNRRTSALANMRGEGVAPWKGIRFQETPANTDRARALVKILLEHEIEVWAHVVDDTTTEYTIPFPQPQSRLIQSMFETRTSFDDTGFYDISAWRFDLAFGLDFTFLDQAPAKDGQVRDLWSITGTLVDAKNAYAYILHWNRREAPAAAHDLMRNGVDMMLAKRGFRDGQVIPGDLIIPAQQQNMEPEELREKLAAAVKQWDINIEAVDPEKGEIVSFGGSGGAPIDMPKIALAVGTGTSGNETGEIWELFDRDMRIPVSLVDASSLDTALDKYNTVILAGGTYPATLGPALTAWVTKGGRLIALGSAASFLSSSEIWKLESKRVTPKLDGLPFDQLAAERGRHDLPGTLFWTEYDTTHPIAYQLPKEVAVFKEGGSFYAASPTAGTNVARYTKNPLAAGYVSPEMLATVDQGAAVLAKRQGSGSVIFIDGNPHFRAFFWSGNRVLMNAVFFGSEF
jgi:hypothetical protein